jgi:hypothetical protein
MKQTNTQPKAQPTTNNKQTIELINSIEFKQTIQDYTLELFDNKEKIINQKIDYKENVDLIQDIKNVLFELTKLNLLPRTTDLKSIMQTVFVNNKNYVCILSMHGNCSKSNSTLPYHRVKYILSLTGLSNLSKKRILINKDKQKLIEVNHIDTNTLNNVLSNLNAIPRKINNNTHYKRLQKIVGSYAQLKYAEHNNCVELLVYLKPVF